jgi:hypothetical protein
LEKALQGHVTPHHRFMLGEHLRRIDELDAAIGRVTQEITSRMSPPEPPGEEVSQEPSERQTEPPPEQVEHSSEPLSQAAVVRKPLTFQEAIQRVDAIPGINIRAAQGILAESGLNMQQFPSSKHFADIRLEFVLVRMKVLANARVARHATATPLYAVYSSKLLMQPLTATIVTWLPNIVGLPAEVGQRRQLWPLHTALR